MSPPTAPHPRTHHVLIVDDDRDFAESVADLVEADGNTVSLAGSAKEATSLVRSSSIDTALVDLRLGQTNGIDLLSGLREIRPDLLCVMMTAFASTDSAISALKHGAYDFLRKPFHRDELMATLHRVFDRLDVEHERATATRALRRYEQIVSSTADMMGFADKHYVYHAVNAAYVEKLERPQEEMVGATLADVHGQAVFDDLLRPAFDRCLGGIEGHEQAWLDFPGGARRFVNIDFYPSTDAEEPELGVVIAFRDLTETRQLTERLSYEASHDALTGLLNRRAFERRLKALIDNARSEDTQHALCYIDLDQFKVINDTSGHGAGDMLLGQLGQILPACVRSGDAFARLGGDEFGVLIPGCTIEHAQRAAESILATIRSTPLTTPDSQHTLGASIGLIPITRESGSVTAVLNQADRACYAAKDAGRNRVHVYHRDDIRVSRFQDDMQWVARLQRALDENQFRLHAQTISATRGGASAGRQFELLLRLVGVDEHLILPGEFLSAAERYGLGPRLDQWVCVNALSWLRSCAADFDDVTMIAINLSAHSLDDDQFHDFLLAEFRSDEQMASKICFEITETAAISSLGSAIRFMEQLRACGCRFALDDFGSGFSSFAYLKSLPIDYLKIDGALVRDIETEATDLAMVKSINDIAHSMGKQTIAEFVESPAILAILESIGVDFVQGYHISRPQPISELGPDVRPFSSDSR